MKIAILCHAYHPDLQGMEQPQILEGDYTQGEAIAEIKDRDNSVYYLEHNEASRPTYLVVDDMTADWIASGRNQDMSNYDWDGATCECGECQDCISMMISQDRDYLRDAAVYNSDEPALLTTAAAAGRLGMSDAHVRRLIIGGKIKATRFGGKSWMIRPADLEGIVKSAKGRRPRKVA